MNRIKQKSRTWLCLSYYDIQLEKASNIQDKNRGRGVSFEIGTNSVEVERAPKRGCNL